jgi:uncharacterized protein
MIQLGKHNELVVLRKTSVGLFLGDKEGSEILLPVKYVPENVIVGDTINVFVYKDSEDRPIATTLTPKILFNQFAFLKAEMLSTHGAFLDWGLEKQLFVPFSEQARQMEEGSYYLVYMYFDQKSERLVASSKINKFLNNDEIHVLEGEEVDIIICEPTELGFNVIINQQYKGLIYNNEIFSPVSTGEFKKGFIRKIREDHKIDVSLQKPGYQNTEPNAAIILEKLKANTGFLTLNDDSSPEEIKQQLGMSKKTFKKAIGLLYKQERIQLTKTGILLVNEE